jgi:rRNA-processing protein FCF1
MMMETNDVNKLLETLAMHHAADKSQHGMEHASRVAKLQVNSWQADVLRNAAEIKSASNASELRELMADNEVPVVFLPQTAFISAEIIDRICRESPFNKMIIWETSK